MMGDLFARIFVLCFLMLYGVFVLAFLHWTVRTWLRSRRDEHPKK